MVATCVRRPFAREILHPFRLCGVPAILRQACNLHSAYVILAAYQKPALPAAMPLDAPRPEFRELAPWPPALRFLSGPTERILQNQLPHRPDNPSHSLIGSAAGLAADAEFAERSGGDFTAERRTRDAERQMAKRTAARA